MSYANSGTHHFPINGKKRECLGMIGKMGRNTVSGKYGGKFLCAENSAPFSANYAENIIGAENKCYIRRIICGEYYVFIYI